MWRIGGIVAVLLILGLTAAGLASVRKIAAGDRSQAIAAMAYGTESIPAVYKIFGPGNQSTHIKRIYSLAFQAFRHIAFDNPEGDTFGDSCFTNARLTNQYRVIFGTA